MKKIGILGGTFDPVHRGHIRLAEDAIAEVGLDEVTMIPAKIQPFKQGRKVTSGDDRFKMLALVAGRDDKITVSKNELDNDGISYTYLTMRRMQEMYSKFYSDGAKLYFICGTDSFLKIETWMCADELLNKYSFIVGTRPGYRQDELATCIKRIKNNHGTEIINIHKKQLNISATVIRERLSNEQPIDDLVPPVVEKYIREKGLYRE